MGRWAASLHSAIRRSSGMGKRHGERRLSQWPQLLLFPLLDIGGSRHWLTDGMGGDNILERAGDEIVNCLRQMGVDPVSVH